MKIKENISLKPFNSFGVEARARHFAEFKNMDELGELLEFNQRLTPTGKRPASRAKRPAPEPPVPIPNAKLPLLVLGGGSNILFTRDFEGLILKNEMKGINVQKEDLHHVYVHAGAGENWHAFVLHCLHNDWAGVENLALIPGNVGASPIQNIGAYGVEVKNVIHTVEAYHLEEKRAHVFSVNDCEFGYRDSIFKGRYRNQFVITGVTYRLNRVPEYNISYNTLEQEMSKMGITEPSIQTIAHAVIGIRSSKLPDPGMIGNAGSFFKNPHVTAEAYHKLRKEFPKLVGYVQENGDYKLAAGWLIEHCGPDQVTSWKGYRRGDAGCHAWQSLVLVNYGNATGREIFDLSEEILQSVKEKFGVVLEREVNII
jgi:UDP-N-acetylmuramate dehydrogenase